MAEMQAEEYVKNLEDLVIARTEQLRKCMEFNYRLVQALATVREHLGQKELALLSQADSWS